VPESGAVRRAPDTLSVGDVAKATGISTATLRVWERRYGTPVPVRLESGHRRYTADQVRRLRRVAEALALGHRAGRVLGCSEPELDALLRASGPEAFADAEIAAWMEHARTADGPALARALQSAAGLHPPRVFLEEKVGPFLREIGRAWADGRLQVRHEHFVSSIVDDALRLYRASIPRTEEPRGVFVLATLAGERHGLGLQMASVLCQVERFRFHVLGTDTPNPEILAAVEETAADALGLSVSLGGGGVETDKRIAALRAGIPARVQMLVGGDGARRNRRGVRGVTYIKSLGEFARWLRRFPAGNRSRPRTKEKPQ
jgi:methanogenic corrinoid protein MtbC1